MARTEGLWENVSGLDAIQPVGIDGYDLLIKGTNKYINFNTSVGSSGYGFRDSGGTMQFKNSGGSWTDVGTGGGGGGGGTTLTAETPSETPDGSRKQFTVVNEPLFVIQDASFRVAGEGYSYSTGTITFDIAPTRWVRSFYNS